MLHSILYWLATKPGLFLLLRKFRHFCFRSEKKVIVDFFSSLPNGSDVLQIACESGFFSTFFEGYNYHGIDLDEAKILYACKHFEGDFRVMDAMALDFGSQLFDGILLSGVFHNIDDITSLQVIRETRRVLKPGGMVFILEDYFPEGRPGLHERIDRYFDPPAVIRTANQYIDLFSPIISLQYQGMIRSGFRKSMVFCSGHKQQAAAQQAE